VIFGGASGIGQCVSEGFAAGGAKVVVADVDAARAEEVARSINDAGGKAISAHTDVTSYSDVAKVFALAVERYKRVDIVVNSAGVLGRQPLLEHESHDFERIIRINLQGTYHAILAGARVMRELRIQGCIINTASVAAYIATPGMIGYHASKGGVRSLTQAMQ
jgi:NAD(P)-dependent dehydrogenase (short-subunit alcohol dehydrogenase family)